LIRIEVGQFLQREVRKEDVVCRYGGEEFSVLLPCTSVEDTQLRAGHLQIGIKQVRDETDSHRNCSI